MTLAAIDTSSLVMATASGLFFEVHRQPPEARR
jgi:hypothetical protein